MSKAPINFELIDSKSLAYLNAFVDARIAIAKEEGGNKDLCKS